MANPARGEVSFEALRKSWTFVFGMNAICAAEEEFDLPFVEVIGEILPGAAGLIDDPDAAKEAAKRMRFGNIRKMLRFGLIEFHDGEADDLTVGSICDELTLPKVTEILGQGLAAALGGGDADAESEGANPRPPRRRSSSR